MPRSTVYAVLKRAGESRLSDGDRSTGVRIRYVRDHPGELIHLDVKKLGRIPEGGVALLGNAARIRRGGGWEYYHVAVDDCSRVAFAQIRERDDAPSTAGAKDGVARWSTPARFRMATLTFSTREEV